MVAIDIKQEQEFHSSSPQYEFEETGHQSSYLNPLPSQNTHLSTSNSLEIPDLEYLAQMRLELQTLAKRWQHEFLSRNQMNPLAHVLINKGEPKTEIDVDETGKLFAAVECGLCNRFIRLGLSKCKSYRGQFSFKCGNYNAHLKLHFSRE